MIGWGNQALEPSPSVGLEQYNYMTHTAPGTSESYTQSSIPLGYPDNHVDQCNHHAHQPHQWLLPPHEHAMTVTSASDLSHGYDYASTQPYPDGGDRGHQGQPLHPSSLELAHPKPHHAIYQCQPLHPLPFKLAHPTLHHSIPSVLLSAWPPTPSPLNQTAYVPSHGSTHAIMQQDLPSGQSSQLGDLEASILNPALFFVPMSQSVPSLAPDSADCPFDKCKSFSSLIHHHSCKVTQPKLNKPPARPSNHRAKQGIIVTVERDQRAEKNDTSSAVMAASQSLSTQTSDVRFIPGYSTTREVSNDCQDEMKIKLFNESLLPSNKDLIAMVDSSWKMAAAQQTNRAVGDWALKKLREELTFVDGKILPVVSSLHQDMQAVVRMFVVREYGLGFDYVVILDDLDIDTRTHRVDHLVENDRFIYSKLVVENVNGVIAFANPAIIAVVTYLLRDSEHQYHNYIGPNCNLKLLLTMITTLYQWALLERQSGLYITSAFFLTENEVHHSHYNLLFDALTPSEVAALTTRLFTNGSVLTC
ncbi:hypothetical protein BDR06DRAFT_1012330 [Suillus hirtellus]|nr:hypothetical protein BDR06DRAFT_1012330 [Suillus hirtellus]